MPTRPLAVAFDVLETLLDLQPLHDRFAEIGQPTQLLQPWFLRVQRDCMALTLSGDVAEFYPAARQALRTESGHSVTEEQIDHVLEAFGTLPAHPDAAPAMRRLAAAGLRVGCLTVGSPDTTAKFLQQAGLAQHVEQVVTAQQVGTWKPAPAVYHASRGLRRSDASARPRGGPRLGLPRRQAGRVPRRLVRTARRCLRRRVHPSGCDR